MRLLVVTVLAVVVLAGCLGRAPPVALDHDPASDFVPGEPQVVLEECASLRGYECFEPTVAVDDAGRVFVSSGKGVEIARSLDGGRTFEVIPTPPMPRTVLPGAQPGDNTLQVDPQGRLFYSALLYSMSVGGQFLAGVHVARSDDGGETWVVNRHLAPNGLPPRAMFAADRQWLAFHPNGDVVYLQYWNFLAGKAFVARSDDAGATFGDFFEMPGMIPGAGVVDADGVLFVPAWTDFDSAEMIVAISGDGGRTFRTTTVAVTGEPVGHLLTSLALDRQTGTLYMAWRSDDGGVMVSTSTDGGESWSEPARWNDAASIAGPFVLVRDGDLFVAWFGHRAGGGSALVLARAPAAFPEPGNATRVDLVTLDDSEPTTDFAWIAVHEGLAHAAVTNHDGQVLHVAQQRAA